MDYREIISLAILVSMVLITWFFVEKLRRTGFDILFRFVAALLIWQSMIHFVTFADLLICSLWHIFGSTVFDWNSEIFREVMENLRQEAQTDGIAVLCMLILWRTGMPVTLGFSNTSGSASDEQYARIEAWQGVSLFCCLAFFLSCVMCIAIYSIPLL